MRLDKQTEGKGPLAPLVGVLNIRTTSQVCSLFAGAPRLRLISIPTDLGDRPTNEKGPSLIVE